MRRARPFSNAALIAEFKRLRWSGRAEDAVRTTRTRLLLLQSIKARLAAEQKAQPSPRPADDYKRRQANDLD